MADGSTTTDSPRVDPFSPEAIARLTGPAKSVALFVVNGIARLRVEAKDAVKAALDAARPEMDRMAREAAAGALAEAQAAKAAADAAVASAESMNAETRRMLDEINKRQEAHDALFDSFDDLNGDGIPDSEQIVPEASFSTEIAVAPQMAPAPLASDEPPSWLEPMVLRILSGILAAREGMPQPEAATAEAVRTYYDGMQVVPGKQLGRIDFATVWNKLAIKAIVRILHERGDLYFSESEKENFEGIAWEETPQFHEFIQDQAETFWTRESRTPEERRAALLGIVDDKG